MSFLKQHLLPTRPPTLLTRARCRGYHPKMTPTTCGQSPTKWSFRETWQPCTYVLQNVQKCVCLHCLEFDAIFPAQRPLPSPAAPNLSSPSPALNISILNSWYRGRCKTNPSALSTGTPSQPCLGNNKPWWRRRTCLSGGLPGERNDLLQPSQQRRSEMGTKGQPSGSRAAQPTGAAPQEGRERS